MVLLLIIIICEFISRNKISVQYNKNRYHHTRKSVSSALNQASKLSFTRKTRFRTENDQYAHIDENE